MDTVERKEEEREDEGEKRERLAVGVVDRLELWSRSSRLDWKALLSG